MKLKMKRTLSCLLTVLLLLTMLPVSALAAGDLKDELGITAENVEVTEISEESKAILSKEAAKRTWGLYTTPGVVVPELGRIHSACHIASAEPTSQPVTITMKVPTQEADEGNGAATAGWVVLALVDGALVTYPAEQVGNEQLEFTVRLGENGTDLALSYLVDMTKMSGNPVGDFGTLTLTPGEVKKDDSLGYVRPYTLTFHMSDGFKYCLADQDYYVGFGLEFYLNSKDLKIDSESVSFGENTLFDPNPDRTVQLDNGQYRFSVNVNRENWIAGNYSDAVGNSFAAPNMEPLLFEGEMRVTGYNGAITGQFFDSEMFGCVPLAITVVNPPEDVNTYHKITVTQREGGEISPRGIENEVWVKEGEPQTFTITPDQGYHIDDVIVDNESVGAVETYTFESVADDSHSITAVFEENPYVTITPADMTIYMGGDGGYEGVVGEDGNLVGEETSYNSLPEPLFRISAPSDVNPTELTFTNKTTQNSWKPVLAGTGSDGTAYYRLADQTDNTPIRVQFVDKDNNVHESDTFNPTDVGNLYVDYDINIFSGKQDVVTVTDTNNKEYNISRQSGTLTVRAVADSNPDDDPTVDVIIDENSLPKVGSTEWLEHLEISEK